MSENQDVVNHPSHYNQYEGFEVIDVCEQLRSPDATGNYNRGNAFKYLARAGWKNPDKEIEDLEKAEFYIRREIERVRTRNAIAAEEKTKQPGESIDEDDFKCPVCGHRLRQDPNFASMWYCAYRNHGFLHVPDGSQAGVWTTGSTLKVKKP